jgi:xylulokinase
MSLLGIDVGTTGCKAGIIDSEGRLLALAYREYEISHPQPGWAEFDSQVVWGKIKEVIAEVAHQVRREAPGDPVKALCVTSCGEAMAPVSNDRRLLGNCLLGLDSRGAEYVQAAGEKLGRERIHAINGNVLGLAYSAPKLAWLRDHQPEQFEAADRFLLWGGLVGYLLGGAPVTDFTLANRTLLFDLHRKDWSPELLNVFDLPRAKLPDIVESGAITGVVANDMAIELGLPPGVRIVAGGHDQSCTALGVGVTRPGQATYSIGTFICITPVHQRLPDRALLEIGMNVEHHVLPDLFVSFLYNASGGALLRWARDTLARREKIELAAQNQDVYDLLMAEMPESPTSLLVLPHFGPCGPPTFETDTSGVIMGLKLETSRGELVKGLLEGMTYYFKEGIDLLSQAGLTVDEYRATGGGSRSPAWLQLSADILGQPIGQVEVSECGVVGAAILAGVGVGEFASATETASQVVRVARRYEPSPARFAAYQERMQLYKVLYPRLAGTLSALNKFL